MKSHLFLMLIVVSVLSAVAQAWTVEDSGMWIGMDVIQNPGMWWEVQDEPAIGGVASWWSGTLMPGVGVSTETLDWHTRYSTSDTNRYAYVPTANAAKWGVIFIDPSWSGRAPDIAAIASYITPGYIFGQRAWGYQPYRPELYPWENKPYFKIDSRMAVVGADEDTLVRISAYAYAVSSDWQIEGALTLISIVDIAVGDFNDYQLNTVRCALDKPRNAESPCGDISATDNVWFEVEVLNGNENTKLYIDEIHIVADEFVNASYQLPIWPLLPPWAWGDFTDNNKVDVGDLLFLTNGWLKNGSFLTRMNGDCTVNFLDFAIFAQYWRIE
jgi:hypothetical protein